MIVLGTILVVAGVAVFLGTRSLFGGQMTWIAPSTTVFGVLLVLRGLKRASA